MVGFSCDPCAIFVSNFCFCVDFESVGTVIHSQVDYSRLAGKLPVLLLNTEGFDWASLRDCRNKFLEGRAKADNVDTPLVTVLMTIKVSRHLSIFMSPNYLSQNNDMSHPWGPKSSRSRFLETPAFKAFRSIHGYLNMPHRAFSNGLRVGQRHNGSKAR
jgi:hypothetical protein